MGRVDLWGGGERKRGRDKSRNPAHWWLWCVLFPTSRLRLVLANLFHGLVEGGGRVGVKQVPLVGVGGNLVLAKDAVVSQLGHPLFEELLRFHLGRFHRHGTHTRLMWATAIQGKKKKKRPQVTFR